MLASVNLKEKTNDLGSKIVRWRYNLDILHNNLVSEITIKKDNIITTSCALVLIKNGRLITLAIKCINAPIVADTCKTIKISLL